MVSLSATDPSGEWISIRCSRPPTSLAEDVPAMKPTVGTMARKDARVAYTPLAIRVTAVVKGS